MNVESKLVSNLHAPHDHNGADGEFDVACEEVFCKLIASRTGIALQDHQLPNLRDTVRKGCERFGYRDCAQYLHALQTSSGLTAQLEYLIAGITVGESYFFRDSEQIELLRTSLLPEMIAAKRANGDLSLRVWSAGCSEGQEIYSIALMLQQLIPDLAKWRIHLLGTDINNEVVAKAMRGRYSEWSFRATPAALRERWFTPVGNEYEIHSQVRHIVRFAYLNLTVDVYPSILSETNAMDLILCRNVFIYLEQQAVQRCMAQYADCLVDQGVLMLGASDPVEYLHTGLVWEQAGKTAFFRKTAQPKPASHANAPPGEKAWKFAPARGEESVPPERPDRERSARAIAPVRPAATECADALAVEQDEIVKLLKHSDWTAALARVEEAFRCGRENSDLWQMKAKALANLGSLELAQQACMRSLQLDHANKHAYLIQGLILSELDRVQEAEEALRKALYLDRSFLEAHYELGMLRVRARDLPGAFRNLENALRLAQQGDPERELHNAAGMTYHRFAQVLQNEIEMLRGAAGEKPRGVAR